MSANNLKFFDFEVFPNWWCCVVSDEEDKYVSEPYKNKFTQLEENNIKSKMRVYTSDDPDAAKKLKADMLIGVLCGYNIKNYDLRIAKGVFSGFSPQKLKIANDLIIADFRQDIVNESAEKQRIASYLRWGWNEAQAWQDLMDDSDKSLKDKECSLGIDIRETTVPFDKEDLTEADKDNIIFYCKHDVYALHVLYVTTSKPYIDTKVDLCKTFNLPMKTAYTQTNANLACKALEAERVHNTTVIDPTITIRDEKLKAYLEKWLPNDIYQHLLTKQEAKTFKMCDNIFDIGDGGLHSVYDTPIIGKEPTAIYVESTDEYTMYNVDVSSCYPSVMMFCSSMSRAIRKPERFHYIYERRLKLKMTPKSQWTVEDKSFVAAGKLVLNTTYGAMGNKYLALYDDYMRTKVCRIGQMILLSICNHLYKEVEGLKIIQTNTDGVLVYAKRSQYNQIQAIVDEFSALSNFAFEVEEDNKLWQLNVNNYVAVHPDGEVKAKGGAFVTTVFQKGTNRLRPLGNFCIPKAQMAFYTTKVNPVKHLLENTNVDDFCMNCTKGPSFRGMIQYVDGKQIDLGKVSRVIAVEDERFGDVKKIKMLKGELKQYTVPLCPTHPLVINDDINNYSISHGILTNRVTRESWNIDYSYYARLLDDALDVTWYEIKNNKCGFTKEFNL